MKHTFIGILSFWLLTGQAFAGSIHGVILYEKVAPKARPYDPGKFKNICGDKVPNESLLIDGNGIKNVVITLSGKKLKKVKSNNNREYSIDQKGCKYTPHILAIPKGSKLKILASDPTNHNIHSYSFDNDPINLMMNPGQSYLHEFEEAELVKVECDLHKWMSAWIVVTENPLFALSDKDGKFEIKDIPPGNYKLTAWHEILGVIAQKVEVGNGLKEVSIDFSDNVPQVSKK